MIRTQMFGRIRIQGIWIRTTGEKITNLYILLVIMCLYSSNLWPPPPPLPRGAVAADPEEQRPHALRRIRGTAQPCPAQAVESQQSRQEAQQI